MQTIIDSGKTIHTTTIEMFNGQYRGKRLKPYLIRNLKVAREIIEAWRNDYNQTRPQSSLDYRTPNEYAASLVYNR